MDARTPTSPTAGSPATAIDDAEDLTFTPPERIYARRPLSERIPPLYPIAVKAHQIRRSVQWRLSDAVWASDHSTQPLDVRVKVHKSLLLRQLGESEMWLQHNKVTNLRLAAQEVNGIIIRPGETFSFNRVVGECTKRRGFVEGMKLSNGAAHPGVGGGICQLANLLHWMFLHSPLTIVERSEHSFDPFPDNGRVLPWGVGVSIVYNYVDLVVRNDTDITFQIFVQVGERYLEGELRADRAPENTYRVSGRHEQFWHHQDSYYRRNEIWRTVIDRRTGDTVREECLAKNCALVTYTPQNVEIHEA